MGVQVSRCADPKVIAQLLERDYFDEPIPSLGRPVVRSLARWYAREREIVFLTAEADGQYAGFLFGHALGRSFWKRFAIRRPWLLPWLILGRRRSKSRLAGAGKGWVRRTHSSAAIDAPCLDRPFAWSRGRLGWVILLWVSEQSRGRAIADKLLSAFSAAMAGIGVGELEAHIDGDNLASVRAFQKAGWTVYRMATGDFWARREIAA